MLMSGTGDEVDILGNGSLVKRLGPPGEAVGLGVRVYGLGVCGFMGLGFRVYGLDLG